MDVFADLGAGAYDSMGIHHGTFIHISADIDIGRGHHDHRRGQVGTPAHGRAARYDPDAVCRRKTARRDGILVEERENAVRHVDGFAQAETAQDHFLDPGVDHPFPVFLLGDTDLPGLQLAEDFIEFL